MYFAARTITTGYYGQSAGTYDHYFQQYLPPVDVLWSFGKVLVFAVLIILVHCFYGYYARRPGGRRRRRGRCAARTSIVAINVLDFFLSLAIWSARPYGLRVSRMRVLRLRLYGVVFLAVLALLLSLSVAVYQQVFTRLYGSSWRPIQNRNSTRSPRRRQAARTAGRRGARGPRRRTKATLDIALKPEYVASIPSDVHARLLPKTLFGEKYVDPEPAPARSSARPIRAGDVITQDRTRVGIESSS